MSDNDHKHVLFGNLNWQVTEEELRKELEQYGTITSLKIPTRRNGRSKGVGIVEFETAESGDRVYEALHTKTFFDRPCFISFGKDDREKKRDHSRDRDRDRDDRDDDRDSYHRRSYRDRDHHRRDSDHYRRERRRRSYTYDYYDDYSDHRYRSRYRSRRSPPPRSYRGSSPEPRRSRDRRSSSEDSP